MTFLHLSLLSIGGLFVAVPVVIHLMMRRRPRHQVFPALRFVQERRQANQRRLRLRHWLLLALRCAAILAFAAALARPTVAAAAFGDWAIFGGLVAAGLGIALLALLAWRNQRGVVLVGGLSMLAGILAVGCVVLLVRFRHHGTGAMLGHQEAPVSAVLVFDTAPRMLYQEGNQTRLELAQELARWLLAQLPRDSEIAVLGTGGGPSTFALDRSIALQAIDTLQVVHTSQPLPEAIENGRTLIKSARHARRELYVFTDLSRASWRTQLDPQITRFTEDDAVLLHVLDVGSLDPRNTSLGDIELSQESLPPGGETRIQTQLLAEGSGGQWKVDFYLEDQDPRRPLVVDGKPLLPERRLRGQQTVQLTADTPRTLTFDLANLGPGTHYGQLQLRGQDGLPLDNVRYFTLAVTDAWPVLIAAPPGAVTRYLTDALAPVRLRETGQARFRCDVVPYERILEADLSTYRVITLLDPPPLTVRQWGHLSQFVQGGGGLAIFLGRNVGDVRAFNTAATELLLPGPPRRHWDAPDNQDIILTLRNASHPMLQFFQPIRDSLSWNQFPIYRHWALGQLSQDSVVVMRYSNDQPAIVERIVGNGRVLLMTTPISDPLNVPERPAWNVLPTDMDPSFFMLVNEMFEYLAGGNRSKLNYTVGEPASIRIPTASSSERFQLFSPAGNWQDIGTEDSVVTVPFTEAIGTYRLRSDVNRNVTWGFSVNLPAAATQLARIDSKQLDDVLGEDQYHVARDRTEINRGIVEARIGRELYPWFVVLTALVLCVELLLSNRFYREATG